MVEELARFDELEVREHIDRAYWLVGVCIFVLCRGIRALPPASS